MTFCSFIIVSFNTREKTLRSLEALHAGLPTSDSEVFVVDNNSSDGSADAVEARFPAVSVIRCERNLGFAAANNLAIRLASGERLLLVNSDAYLKPGTIKALNRYLDEHPESAAVGPRLLNLDGSLQPSCFKFPGPTRSLFDFLLLTAAFPNHHRIGDYRAWPHDQDRTVDFVSGACLLIRRSALRAVGLFDEDFFFYFEEADWCLRAKRAGWEIGFAAGAEVVHEGGGSGKAQPVAVFYEFQRGHERLIRKHYGSAALTVHRICLGVGAALRITIFSLGRFLGRGDPETICKWTMILAWSVGKRGTGLAIMKSHQFAFPDKLQAR